MSEYKLTINDNELYKLNSSNYIYVKEIKNPTPYIFGYYTVRPELGDDKYIEEFLISFSDIDKFVIIIDSLTVLIMFRRDKTSQSEIIKFNNFSEILGFINLMTELIYKKPLFRPSNTNINVHENSAKLEDLETALLMNTFDVPYDDNIFVSQMYNDNQMIKYYYDLKIFPFGNKNIFMHFDVSEGSESCCHIRFFMSFHLLKSNGSFSNEYCVDILNIDDNTKFSINRLSKENYHILANWIKQKLQ